MLAYIFLYPGIASKKSTYHYHFLTCPMTALRRRMVQDDQQIVQQPSVIIRLLFLPRIRKSEYKLQIHTDTPNTYFECSKLRKQALNDDCETIYDSRVNTLANAGVAGRMISRLTTTGGSSGSFGFPFVSLISPFSRAMLMTALKDQG